MLALYMYIALPILVWFQCRSFFYAVASENFNGFDSITFWRWHPFVFIFTLLSRRREWWNYLCESLSCSRLHLFMIASFLQWVNSEVRQRPHAAIFKYQLSLVFSYFSMASSAADELSQVQAAGCGVMVIPFGSTSHYLCIVMFYV
jgi:hypothetical protein